MRIVRILLALGCVIAALGGLSASGAERTVLMELFTASG
jgi:hypothetical protein